MAHKSSTFETDLYSPGFLEYTIQTRSTCINLRAACDEPLSQGLEQRGLADPLLKFHKSRTHGAEAARRSIIAWQHVCRRAISEFKLQRRWLKFKWKQHCAAPIFQGEQWRC